MSQNGWTKWVKQSKGSRYAAYENQMVVIISDAKKSSFLYLAPPVVNVLKNPDHIAVHTRGSNIGLFRGESASEDYTVVTNFTSFPYISLASLFKTWKLAPGVYTAHVEDDHVVFDTQQKPSQV